MQWLLKLETDRDPIVICRLMNIFRRKSVAIENMTLAANAESFSCVAVVDTPAAEIDHMFNFLRRTDGVRDVACYQHEPSSTASFIFFDSGSQPEAAARVLAAFPQCKIVFASHGKYLLEIPAENDPGRNEVDLIGAGSLRFAQIKTSRPGSLNELAGAVSN